MRQLKAVCFDAFGTVVEITDRRDPYRKLFERVEISFSLGRRVALTVDDDIEGILARLDHGYFADLAGFRNELAVELASVRLFPDTINALTRLREKGRKIWIISNLAEPYGKPLEVLLGRYVDGFTFSYRCGVVKPDLGIFTDACSRLNCSPDEVLMVGDKQRNDVEGAMAAGIQARLIDRDGKSDEPHVIRSLKEIIGVTRDI